MYTDIINLYTFPCPTVASDRYKVIYMYLLHAGIITSKMWRRYLSTSVCREEVDKQISTGMDNVSVHTYRKVVLYFSLRTHACTHARMMRAWLHGWVRVVTLDSALHCIVVAKAKKDHLYLDIYLYAIKIILPLRRDCPCMRKSMQ